MRIITEQQLPTDLGTLRKFIEHATRLVDGDVTAFVSQESGWLRVCGVKDLEVD